MTSRLDLAGRSALVTGGAGGIGAAVVRVLIDAGADVASADLPGRPAPSGAVELACDLGSPDSVRGLFAAWDERFERLDALVHCAGITDDAVLWKLGDEAWERVLRINLGSSFYLLREAVPRMRAGGGGAVVLVSSINGERGKIGQANYAASKAGLIGLARTAARETGRFGIRVNVVAPGLIETAMAAKLAPEQRERAVSETVLGRIGKPENVADAVLFLVSGMSAHVTGQVLRVDGGQLIG